MLPDYIQKVLDGPAPGAGARHQALLDLSYQMVGHRIPDDEIFRTLRAWMPDKDKTDKEIRDLIRGAHARNPKPAESRQRYQVEYNQERKTVKFTVSSLNQTPTPDEVPTSALSTVEFLSTMFREGETVCITNHYTEAGDKLIPGDKGTFWSREQWCEWLERGKLDGEAGAWVRINPVKEGDKSGTDSSVSDFRHVLVEFDGRPKIEQWHIFKESGLPLACVIDSGGKSLHAWVRVDAKDLAEYKNRQRLVYERLADFIDDHSNINPSRFSRLPGIRRCDQIQKLVAVNIGAEDWNEFEEWSLDDGLPPMVSGDEFENQKIPKPPEVLKGLLFKGGILVLGSPSKARKTFNLISLALAIKEGKKWLGFECDKGDVLYANFELIPYTMHNRCLWIREAMGIRSLEGMTIWNLRGCATDIEKVVNRFVARLNRHKDRFSAIILDPSYMCLGDRDENSAGDMTDFYNHVMRLTKETGSAVIIASHYAKGDHNAKAAIDRVAGSGVQQRFPDAVVNLTPLKADDENPHEFDVNIKLRDFTYIPAFRIEWREPLFQLSDVDVAAEKASKRVSKLIELLECLEEGPLKGPDWQAIASEDGIADDSYFRHLRGEAKKLGLVTDDKRTRLWTLDAAAYEAFKSKNTTTFRPKKKS
jgi:RecA-family ATPase